MKQLFYISLFSIFLLSACSLSNGISDDFLAENPKIDSMLTSWEAAPAHHKNAFLDDLSLAFDLERSDLEQILNYWMNGLPDLSLICKDAYESGDRDQCSDSNSPFCQEGDPLSELPSIADLSFEFDGFISIEDQDTYLASTSPYVGSGGAGVCATHEGAHWHFKEDSLLSAEDQFQYDLIPEDMGYLIPVYAPVAGMVTLETCVDTGFNDQYTVHLIFAEADEEDVFYQLDIALEPMNGDYCSDGSFDFGELFMVEHLEMVEEGDLLTYMLVPRANMANHIHSTVTLTSSSDDDEPDSFYCPNIFNAEEDTRFLSKVVQGEFCTLEPEYLYENSSPCYDLSEVEVQGQIDYFNY